MLEQVFDYRRPVDRFHELEIMRRSIAMLTPGSKVLSREEALTLLEELSEVRRRLDRLTLGLRRLVQDSEQR